MPTVNATHRKRLARALAEREHITYMAALDRVTQAAVAGALPSTLDETGMQAALRVLSTPTDLTAVPGGALVEPASVAAVADPVESPVRRMASDARDQSLYDLSFQYESLTGQQGLLYITSPDGKVDKYVFGGGFVALGRKEALAHLETLVADARLLRGDGERYYLIPEALRLLRKVWQGRVTLTSVGWDRKRTRFAIDDTAASDINDLYLRWLHQHLYLSASLSPGEDWAVARTTEFGDEVLARNGADIDKFHDGLPVDTSSKGLTHADVQRCPVRSLSAGHYNTDGTCACPPALKEQPMQTGRGASDDANPYQDFNVTGTATADVRGLLKVQQRLLDAGRVEWWWHTGPFKGSHGFKTVTGVNDAGDLILRDENPKATQPTTALSLDYIDEPDKATRHLVWPEHSGVTFLDKTTGELDATYRVAGPAPAPANKTPVVRKVIRGKNTNHGALDPVLDRLMGGPTTTKVYDSHNRRVNATCDVCNRRLATGEPWWMVKSSQRNWENDAGVVCGRHDPDQLPLHTVSDTPDAEGEVGPSSRPPVTAESVASKVHKARPNESETHCAVCMQPVKRVSGGQGPTWIHAETGRVAASGPDPARTTDAGASATVGTKTRDPLMMVAHEGNPTPRCTGSSWRGNVGKRTSAYGPGGYNRCVKADGHAPEGGGSDPMHVDEWGNVFRLSPKFKVVRAITNAEMAEVAREAGMDVAATFDRNPLWHKQQNTLWMTKDGEMVKVSNVYEDEERVTGQVVYPVPPRTTVRSYPAAEVAQWLEPSDAQVRKYERAWGFDN